jgi:mannose-6-phosphate isomerase-like protein (cupin superfamily)
MFPPVGGFRVNIAQFADADVYGDELPQTPTQRAGSEQVVNIVHGNEAGWIEYPPVANLHRTDTTEIGYLISGEIEVEASNGDIAHLKAGDVLIQNGAPHRWRNFRGRQATIFLVSLPGKRLPSKDGVENV